MEKTTLYLPKELQVRLRTAAVQLGRSQAELLRDALDSYLGSQPRKLPSVVGKARSGAVDAAEYESYMASHWKPD